jgi:hypothetical protein
LILPLVPVNDGHITEPQDKTGLFPLIQILLLNLPHICSPNPKGKKVYCHTLSSGTSVPRNKHVNTVFLNIRILISHKFSFPKLPLEGAEEINFALFLSNTTKLKYE